MRIPSFQNQPFFSFSGLKNAIKARPIFSTTLLVTAAIFSACKFSIPGYSFLSTKRVDDPESLDDFKICDIAFRWPPQKTLRHSVMLKEINIDLNRVFKERLSSELPKQISFDWTVGIIDNTESKQRFSMLSWYWTDLLREQFKRDFGISDLVSSSFPETNPERIISKILKDQITDGIFESASKIPPKDCENFLKSKIPEIKDKLNESLEQIGLQILKIEMQTSKIN